MWYCKQCGSSDVEYKAWFHYNRCEVTDIVDEGESWCNNCQDFVDVEEEDDD